jgi:hypothetical protein
VSDIAEGRSRLTLRFADASLERDFQAELARTNAPQLRVGLITGIALWLATALLFPATLSAQPGLVVATCLIMAVLNLAGLIATRWAVTLDGQQTIALALNARGAVTTFLVRGRTTAAPAREDRVAQR